MARTWALKKDSVNTTIIHWYSTPLTSSGIHGWSWRSQTFGTILGELASVRISSSSTGTPGSPSPSWRIILVAACRSPFRGHRVGTASWRPAFWPQGPCLLLCSAPSRWMSSSLPGQRSLLNPVLSSPRSPSPQCGLCPGGFTVKTCMIAREFIKRGLNWPMRYRMYI